MPRGVPIPRALAETVLRMNIDGMSSDRIFELTRVPRRSQERIMQRFRNTGQAHPVPTGLPLGRPRQLSTEEVMIILGIATNEERYDSYLDEIRQELAEAGGRDISEATAWRYLKRSGHTMKKITKVAIERNMEARALYQAELASFYQPNQSQLTAG
ncbi:hypothetical protein C8J56DRAFT_893133 [Mycena floridula]|nr:hypothetical protein C8J56DRAFT_893133 [Mycena floridula]